MNNYARMTDTGEKIDTSAASVRSNFDDASLGGKELIPRRSHYRAGKINMIQEKDRN